jgi:hypothetical protein
MIFKIIEFDLMEKCNLTLREKMLKIEFGFS